MINIKKKNQEFYSLWNQIDLLKKEKVLEYLKGSDYFIAPSSTRFHSSFEGGLLVHSLNVVYYLLYLTDKLQLKWERPESPIIIGLLHDLCKTNFYNVEYKNAKNEKGELIKVPYYTIKDLNPIGVHGDKSVMLIQKLGFKLTDEELYCIRFHMGAYEGKEVFSSLGEAKKKYPNILYTCLADELATIWEDEVCL